MTGFNTPLPTDLDSFAFSEVDEILFSLVERKQQLSNEGLRAYLDGLLLSFGPLTFPNSFTFKTGIKLTGKSEFVEGNGFNKFTYSNLGMLW